MLVTPKQLVSFVAQVFAQYAAITASVWLLGGAMSLLLACVIGLLAAFCAESWVEETGYDLAVEGAGRALAFFRSFGKAEA